MDRSLKPSSRARAWLIPLLVAAATLLVFWPCVHNGFINADDPRFLVRPYRGLDFASIRGVFGNFYFCNYVPLSLLSFSADFAVWGLNPFGYHLTNILLHAAGAAVFYLLCLELLSAGEARGGDRPAAAAAALFFSLHPLRVQSVAWISERRDVLCGVFFLLTLLFWLRSFRAGRLSGARGKALALATFLFALMSKPAAVPLPLVLVLLDVRPLRRLPASPRRWAAAPLWIEKLPFFALSALFAAFAVAAQSKGGAVVSLADKGLLPRAEQVGLNLVYYLGKLLWPVDFSFYGQHWGPYRAAALAGTAATAVLLAVAARSRRLRAPLLCALAYQTVMLAPVLGFVTVGHELAADRYSYLSGLAWAVLFGAGLRSLPPRRRTASSVFSCVLLAGLAAATRAQIAVWRDSVPVWKRMLRVDPDSIDARPMLAQALMSEGRSGEAILYLEEHARLHPEDEQAVRTLEAYVAKTGTTVRDHAGFHERLGLEFAARGEYAKAAWHFQQGLRYDPDSRRLRAELESAVRATAGDGAR